MNAARTYLDYNATAPLRPEARAAMLAAMDLVGNPSSVHAEGRRARAVIEAARGHVAKLVGARSADVVFTSGASEANATVLAGDWDTIFLSALEHDSVRAAAKKSGARLIEMPIGVDGQVDTAGCADLIAKAEKKGAERTLVCLQLANNETGVIQPVAEIAALARAMGIRVHCDAVQAPGRVAVDCGALGVDFLTVSSHKLGGPKGAGALVIVDGVALPALITGGGQERGRRAGTENLAALAGFGVAAQLAMADFGGAADVAALRDSFESAVSVLTPQAVVIGQGAARLGNTSCVAWPGLQAETMVIRMDLAGVAVSAGAACSSGKVSHSAALAAQGLPLDVARSAIRVSFGCGSTADDVQAALAAWTSLAAVRAQAA